jgi:hypothetical protein
MLFITKITGESIYKDSLSYLPSEEQQHIRSEYNNLIDNGEFPTPSRSLNPDKTEPIPKYLVHKEYELIPIAGNLKSELIDRLYKTYKQAVSSVYKGQLYFYNSENNIAFCLESNKQGPPTLFEIKNPEFTHQLPHLVEQFDEYLRDKKQETPGANIQVAYDFAALLDLIMFARRNLEFFACMENFTKTLLFSVKNNDDYKTIASLLNNYQNHDSLFKTFLRTIELLPKEELLRLASLLNNYQNHASLFKVLLRTIELLPEEKLLRLEENLLKLNNQYENN